LECMGRIRGTLWGFIATEMAFVFSIQGEVFFEDRADFQGFLSEFVDLCSRDVLLYAAEKEAREAAATDEHQRAEKHNAAPVQAHQVY
jgi:hypothetical protein